MSILQETGLFCILPTGLGKTTVTFGTKTRQSVRVVQNMMNTEMMTNEAVCSSFSTKVTATPRMHMMATLYTDIPTYLESFRAGICTDLVSHAKKAPNNYKSLVKIRLVLSVTDKNGENKRLCIPLLRDLLGRKNVQSNMCCPSYHQKPFVDISAADKDWHVRRVAKLDPRDYLNAIVLIQ